VAFSPLAIDSGKKLKKVNMSTNITRFYDLRFRKVKHYLTKSTLREGDIKEDDQYFGVAHVHNIKRYTYVGSVFGAEVDLYVAPFRQTNPLAKKTGITHHRVMMEGLSLWRKFEGLKQRACDNKGNPSNNFHVEREPELFYGFERKNNVWYSTSSTLNCWIKTLIGKEVVDAERNAGFEKSNVSKSDVINQINQMPFYCWKQVLPMLEILTPFDGKPWTCEWATSAGTGLVGGQVLEFKKEELNRMRRLVFMGGKGSELYSLDLKGKKIGRGGLSAVQALSTILQEKRNNDKMPRAHDLKILRLYSNELNDDHLTILARAISKCRKLKELNLNVNNFGDEGCVALSNCLPSSLEELHLHWNNIGDKGCMAISSSKAKKVSVLDLRNNKIGQDGCAVLLKLGLEDLRLWDNPGYVQNRCFEADTDDSMNIDETQGSDSVIIVQPVKGCGCSCLVQ